jgi:ER lumen protein retaining receptor
VSLISQVLYALVFLSRYLDILHTYPFDNHTTLYLFSAKLFYIGTSLYIVFLMTFVYARTREREKAWKFGMWCLIVAAILAVPVNKVFERGPMVPVRDGDDKFMYYHDFTFTEVCPSAVSTIAA